MATQGPNFAGTGANDNSFGDQPWNNPSRVTAQDGSSSSAGIGFAIITQYLKATNFGFSIPAGSTINGIEAVIRRSVSAGTGNGVDSRIRIVKANGSISTTDKSIGTSWSTSLRDDTYGGAADLWGETWTADDINNSNFGLVVSCERTASTGSANVDSVKITIHYTEAAPEDPTYLTQQSGRLLFQENGRGITL